MNKKVFALLMAITVSFTPIIKNYSYAEFENKIEKEIVELNEKINKEELIKITYKLEGILEGIDKNSYTKDSIENMVKKIEKAKFIIKTSESQDEIDMYLLELNNTKLVKNIVENPNDIISLSKNNTKKEILPKKPMPKHIKSYIRSNNSNQRKILKKKIINNKNNKSSNNNDSKKLPKAGIDNEQILIAIACVAIISGAFITFFKNKDNKK